MNIEFIYMPDSNTHIRTIEILATGERFEQSNRKYIGTIQLEGDLLVFHVFERFN